MAANATKLGRLSAQSYDNRVLDATPQAIGTGAAAATIYALEVNNTANSTAVYVKIFNKGTSPAVGTDYPDEVYRIPALTTMSILMSGDGTTTISVPSTDPPGLEFLLGCWIICVTSADVTGVTGPTNPVIASIEADS